MTINCQCTGVYKSIHIGNHRCKSRRYVTRENIKVREGRMNPTPALKPKIENVIYKIKLNHFNMQSDYVNIRLI